MKAFLKVCLKIYRFCALRHSHTLSSQKPSKMVISFLCLALTTVTNDTLPINSLYFGCKTSPVPKVHQSSINLPPAVILAFPRELELKS